MELAYHNWVFGDAEFSEADVPDGIERLADPRLSQRWNVFTTTGLHNHGFTVSWPEPHPVQMVALLGLGPGVSDENDRVFSLPRWGFALYPELTGPPDVEAFDLEPQTLPTDAFPNRQYLVLDEPVMAQRLVMNFASDSGDGGLRFSLGALWAGPVWRPPEGIRRGWRPRMIEGGRMRRTPAGQGYPRRRGRYRGLSVSLSHVPIEQAIGRPDGSILDLQQLAFRIGLTERCIVLPRTVNAAGQRDVHAMHRLGIYGHATRIDGPTHVAGDTWSMDMDFEELG